MACSNPELGLITINEILTSIERSELLSRHKTEREGRVADLIKAVILHDDGWTSARISEALLIDDATIRFYIKTYLEEQRVTPAHKGSSLLLTSLESEYTCTSSGKQALYGD